MLKDVSLRLSLAENKVVTLFAIIHVLDGYVGLLLLSNKLWELIIIN